MTVTEPDPPFGIVICDGETDTRKSGVGAGMVSRRLAELVTVFDLTVEEPVIVMLKLPEGAEGPTASLSLVVTEAPVRTRID